MNSKKDEHRDPVCNMTVAGDSKYQYRNAGGQYYFCCEHCLNKFKEHPGQYLEKGSSPSHESHGEPVPYT
ncbi:MAG TPA: YHS domain-containing protein, partial [Patescibacteria group bacterium]|nr:YHS domain-containing protein [Patescibacteria group bacterium]